MGQRKAPCAFEPHVKEILHPVRGAGRSHLHRYHRAHQGHFDLQAREGRAPCDLRRPLRRECYAIAAEQSAVEVENHEPFGAKWSMFCRLKVRSYVLAANAAGTLKVAPLQILKFPVVLPHKFWMPRSSICGFRTHLRSRKLRTSCGGIAIKRTSSA